jgi:hypothetical protein
MFSHELDFYIKFRNNTLSPQEYIFVTNLHNSPQINYVKYEPFQNEFYIGTKDGWSWTIKLK